MWFRGEERLVHVHLGVRVDGVVSNIQKLDDLGLRKLFDDAFSRLLVFDELARDLENTRLI